MKRAERFLKEAKAHAKSGMDVLENITDAVPGSDIGQQLSTAASQLQQAANHLIELRGLLTPNTAA